MIDFKSYRAEFELIYRRPTERDARKFSQGRPSFGSFSWASKKRTGVWGGAPYILMFFKEPASLHPELVEGSVPFTGLPLRFYKIDLEIVYSK
jgi:hypothetical protein